MATSNEGTLRVDVEIELNGGLNRGMVDPRATINSMQIEGATWVELGEVSKPHEGSRRRRWKHRAKAQSFPWTKVNDMNSYRGKSRLILYGVKDEGSFKAHAPYLREAFDRVTKVIQLAEDQDPDNGAPMLAKSMDFKSYYVIDFPRAMFHPGVTREWGAKLEDKAE
ncbi:hypothetical protein GW17_00006475 [Ensete ventricosum]|nr:hypothetical protein GW17_00006475 [Ensete ventricosum]